MLALIPRIIGCLGLAAAVAVLAAARPPDQTGKGSDDCAACHEDVAKGFARNPHAAPGGASCASCHAGSAKHLEEGGGRNILAFKPADLPNAKTKACLSCHADDQSRFPAGPHGQASLDCASCHSVHAAGRNEALLKDKESKTCGACHQEILSRFQLNERHRLQEGILACSSCHDPHVPQAGAPALGGFKHEACFKCHADKGGPFLHEHGASRLEGCTICHEPHGSPNRHLLVTQSVSNLCFGCHVFAPSWHSKFDAKATNCVSCHAAIHGSHLSRIFLK
jgi:DmsE family decaheme c-type cytochrome